MLHLNGNQNCSQSQLQYNFKLQNNIKWQSLLSARKIVVCLLICFTCSVSWFTTQLVVRNESQNWFGRSFEFEFIRKIKTILLLPFPVLNNIQILSSEMVSLIVTYWIYNNLSVEHNSRKKTWKEWKKYNNFWIKTTSKFFKSCFVIWQKTPTLTHSFFI